jgi:hypothetical protein
LTESAGLAGTLPNTALEDDHFPSCVERMVGWLRRKQRLVAQKTKAAVKLSSDTLLDVDDEATAMATPPDRSTDCHTPTRCARLLPPPPNFLGFAHLRGSFASAWGQGGRGANGAGGSTQDGLPSLRGPLHPYHAPLQRPIKEGGGAAYLELVFCRRRWLLDECVTLLSIKRGHTPFWASSCGMSPEALSKKVQTPHT